MSVRKKDDQICMEQLALGELKITIKQDAQAKSALAKRSHDVTGALRSLRFALEALQDGYKFDDEMREAKLASVSRALANLEKEAEWLQVLFLT